MKRSSRAEPILAGLAVLALAAPASAQVCHRGVVSGTTIRWETTFAGPRRFLGPLPEDVEIDRVDGGSLVTEGGRAVGVAPAAPGTGVVVALTQTIAGDGVVLHPPLVHGLQRVVLDAGDHQLLS